jgi:hypothetical protein
MAVQTNTTSFSQRLESYQPSKSTLAWACVAAAIATMIVGFNWGGWVTGGTSREMAATAATAARGELASDICVERFNTASDAVARLAELKAITGSFAQQKFVEAGGWATMPGQSSADSRGAAGCAAALVA